MIYKIILTKQFLRDLEQLKRSGDKISVNKIARLLSELEEHPKVGTGKPEPLKHNLSGLWSRRINKYDRLIYQINDDKVIVEVLTAKGHYE